MDKTEFTFAILCETELHNYLHTPPQPRTKQQSSLPYSSRTRKTICTILSYVKFNVFYPSDAVRRHAQFDYVPSPAKMALTIQN